MKIKLYHGTINSSKNNIINNGIDVNYTNKVGDFGIGFYLSKDVFNAEYIANRKAHLTKEKPCIIELTIQSSKNNLRVKEFMNKTMNSEEDLIKWAQFIVNNRCGMEYIKNVSSKYGFEDNNLDNRYDIIIGKTADGHITKIASMCKDEQRLITSKEAKSLLSKNYGVQYCISTIKGLSIISTGPTERKECREDEQKRIRRS